MNKIIAGILTGIIAGVAVTILALLFLFTGGAILTILEDYKNYDHATN